MTRGPRPRPWESRFLPKVALPDENGCMRWLGCIQRDGYGRFGVRAGDVRNAHRVSHELWNGPIPEGYDVDHLCRNRWCVAPTHLEARDSADQPPAWGRLPGSASQADPLRPGPRVLGIERVPGPEGAPPVPRVRPVLEQPARDTRPASEGSGVHVIDLRDIVPGLPIGSLLTPEMVAADPEFTDHPGALYLELHDLYVALFDERGNDKMIELWMVAHAVATSVNGAVCR